MNPLHSCPFLSVSSAYSTGDSGLRTFGLGPGACVGKPLAMLGKSQTDTWKRPAHGVLTTELRMTTAYFVRDLELKFASDYKKTWESDWRDYFVMQKGELPVVVSPRA